MKRLLLTIFITFLLSIQIASAAELTISTDKTEYFVGETVSISSTLSPVENETISNATITITIEQESSFIVDSINAGTSASYEWVTDRTGSIDIKADAAWDNESTSTQTSISVNVKALNAVLTGIGDQYYPAEYPEARITVTDENGNVVTDASITAYLLHNEESMKYIHFSYSALCDCYKGWIWIEEGYQGTYTLNISISKTDYDSVSLTKSFEVTKPSLVLSLSTDKSSYYPDEKILITINAEDEHGNPVDAYLSGEIRDENGFLVENLYPWKDGDVYKEDYYVRLEDVGKTVTITVNGEWKEQEDSKSVTVELSPIGLMVEVFLDSTTLKPGDYLTGKIEVKDKEGNIISDAWVDATLYDPNRVHAFYLSTDYNDGYYVLEKKKIDEWQMAGEYTLKVKVEKSGDKKEIEKTIKIEKNELGVKVELDKASYKPGDRIYLKILVTDPQGNVVQDAWVSGEIFPLTTETRQPEEWHESPQICRMYISPEGPVYYQGEFIQKYFVDEVYINDWCPIDTYVLRLKVGKGGYEDVEIEEEFEVVLMKLLMETGTKIVSEEYSAKINVYAELRDENGKIVRDVKVRGYLHPTEEKGCIKRVDLHFDDRTGRHTTTLYINKDECPEGKYNLELEAKHPSYSPVNTTHIIEIKYKEGYEYRDLTPIVVRAPVCRVVSCGPDCFQKICERENPCTITIDKDCMVECRKLLEEGLNAEAVSKCVKGCERQECAPGGSSEQEMMKKLEEIHKEVRETKEKVGVVQRMINSIWNFLRSIFNMPPITEEGIIAETPEVIEEEPTNETIVETPVNVTTET